MKTYMRCERCGEYIKTTYGEYAPHYQFSLQNYFFNKMFTNRIDFNFSVCEKCGNDIADFIKGTGILKEFKYK